jgi:drug/metabolite transporter (DMT)-like permease
MKDQGSEPCVQEESPSHVITYVKLTLVAALWGGTFVAGRIVAETLAPLHAAIGRFAIATLLLLVLSWVIEGGLPRLNSRQLVVTCVLGATGIFLYNVSFFTALSYIPAGRTALFVALNPIVTALILAAFFHERLSPQQWFGIFIALCGAIIVISRGDIAAMIEDVSSSFGFGELAMMCAVLSWAAYTIIGRYALKGLSPIAATTYAALWGLALLILVSLVITQAPIPDAISWGAGLCLFYLGAFGTVIAFIWYYQGLKKIGAARVAIFNNLVPVFGVFQAFLFLDEPLLASMIIGGVLVMAGVTLTNRKISVS